MPVLEFDAYGNLKPYEVILLNIDSFKEEFVTEFADSERRSLLFNTFLAELTDFKTIVNEEFWVWINGSFVTQKTNPSDIDFVIFLDAECYNRHEEQTNRFRQQRYIPGKLIDGYFVQVYPEGHRRNNWYESDRLRWLQDFGTSLAGRKKGIVQLNF